MQNVSCQVLGLSSTLKSMLIKKAFTMDLSCDLNFNESVVSLDRHVLEPEIKVIIKECC